jgi:cytochrome c peroxidase
VALATTRDFLSRPQRHRTSLEEQQFGEPIQPFSITIMFDLWKPVLGKQLFNEPRLSRDNTGSCASYQKLDYGGMNGASAIYGNGGASGMIETPTVFKRGLKDLSTTSNRSAETIL